MDEVGLGYHERTFGGTVVALLSDVIAAMAHALQNMRPFIDFQADAGLSVLLACKRYWTVRSAMYSQVSMTVSGFRDTLEMPLSNNQAARSG
jgi:hypothetical protein